MMVKTIYGLANMKALKNKKAKMLRENDER